MRAYSGEQQSAWAPEGYGAEPTPELYVEHTVEVLRAIRRVLKPSGVVWWNVGDSYAAQGGAGFGKQGATSQRGGRRNIREQPSGHIVPDGLKPKDMVLIPQRVALAAQADGWYVRADVIWAKPNPMPESVRDRPTKAHEYVWLLSKAERYFWDADAVREDASVASLARIAQPNFANQTGGPKDYRNGTNPNRSARTALENFAKNPGRNMRSVWTMATQPSPLPHFASFPEELPERCIKAACPADGVVLDPFAGTGTTLKVARDLGRKAIGIEISSEYVELAVKRLSYGVRGVLAMKRGQGALL